MKYDYKLNVENKLVALQYKVHIHWDIDGDEYRVHCMVMQNNRYARE